MTMTIAGVIRPETGQEMQGAGLGRRLPAFERWLATVATLFGTDAAVLMIHEGGRSRVLACHGIRHRMMTYPFDVGIAPYKAGDTILSKDASGQPELHNILADNALDRTHFFFRTPVVLEAGRSVALVSFGREARPNIGDRELRLVQEIVAEIAAELADLVTPLKAPVTLQTLGFFTQGLTDWVLAHPLPTALLGENLEILVANEPLFALFAKPSHVREQDNLSDIDLPARDSLVYFFRRALETWTSTQEIEICVAAYRRTPERYYSVMASPLQPADRATPCLVVTVADITLAVRTQTDFEAHNLRDTETAPSPAEATAAFLQETLVERRAIRSRKGVSYITLRAWRQSIRAHQIRALRALKSASPDALAGHVAETIRTEVEALVGLNAFRAIVPVPCGHSGTGTCLSRAVAMALGRMLGLPVIEALRLPVMRGSSHPKTNTRRPRMRLNRALEGPVLVVDDVATSGQHIEEACRLLRPVAGTALAIVWIGGDADDPAE
jgi:hypothetical protein